MNLNLDMNTILAGLVLGIVGFGFFKHGKSTAKPLHMIVGLGLMVVPYFIESTGPMLAVSGVLILLPLATRWF